MINTIKNVSAKLTAGTVAIVMAVTFAAPAVQADSDSTVDALQAQINALLAQLNVLNDDDNSSSAEAGSYVHQPNTAFEFNTNLYLGARGTDVMMLQKALNENSATQVAVTGAGSPGNETEYFGPATLAAVKKFQSINGISPAAGYFYPLTRAEMNERVTVIIDNDDDDDDSSEAEIEVSETNTADGGDFTNGVTRYIATSFEVEADEDTTITGITVRYSGRPDEDKIIESLVLADEDGNFLSEDEDLDSDEEAEFDNLRIDLEDGDSMEILVLLNATSGTSAEDDFEDEDGLDFEIEVVEIEADADVDGLPVVGPEHTVEDNTVGDIDADIDNEGGNIEIGEEDELLATIELTANPDDSDDLVYIRQVRIENTGTGDLNDLEDLYAELDGEEYEGMVSPIDDDFIVFNFDDFEMEDGDSEDIEIRGTAVVEAGDTFSFEIDEDESYNIYVLHEEGYGMPVNIDNDGVSTEVEQGSLSIAVSDDDESDEVSPGDDILLGLFEMDIDGEDVEVDEMVFMIDLSNGTTTDNGELEDLLLEDIYLEDEDGNRVTDTEDAEWVVESATGSMMVEFDNIDLERGDDVTYRIFATIDDNVGTDTEYEFSLDSADIDGVEGKSSDEDITPSGSVTMEERTVEAGDLIYSISGSPSSRTISDDEDQTVFARVQFDAGASGEDIELESFEISLNVATTSPYMGAFDADDDAVDKLTNCRLYDEDDEEVELDQDVDGSDGNLTGSTAVFDFDLDNDLLIEADDIIELELRCDIGSVEDGVTYQWEIESDAEVEAKGVETNNDIVVVIEDDNGGTMTIGEAEIQVSEDASSPSTELLVEGNDVILGVLEIESEDGDVLIEDIELELASGTDETLDRGRVYLFVDGDEVGFARFTSATTDTVEDVNILIEDDESVEIEFRAKVSDSIGNEEDAENGSPIGITVASVTPEDDDVTVSGSNIAFDVHYVFETVPSVAQVSFPNENVELTSGSNRELLRFSVSADEAGDVTIGAMTFEVTGDTDTIATDTLEVEVFTSSSMSNKVSVNDGDFDVALSGTDGVVNFKDDNTDNYLEIPDGSTYYFKVIADLTGVTDGDEISVSLNEDASFSTGVDAAASATSTIEGVGNFVWTPDFMGLSEDSTYFNGFEVEGMDADIQATRINEN